jgi:hypothetical protein
LASPFAIRCQQALSGHPVALMPCVKSQTLNHCLACRDPWKSEQIIAVRAEKATEGSQRITGKFQAGCLVDFQPFFLVAISHLGWGSADGLGSGAMGRTW